jgi:hypothetical protein
MRGAVADNLLFYGGYLEALRLPIANEPAEPAQIALKGTLQ